jgi:FAD/FMN-containing dehydrogenase
LTGSGHNQSMSNDHAPSTSLADGLNALRGDLTGDLVLPGDSAYDHARGVWNGMIDRRPLAVVRARSESDIAPTIAVARDRGLPLAIRGGGHNVAGNGTVDDGIVLDLRALDAVTVDPASHEVQVGPGATLADVDLATEPHHLAVPIGVVSGTGMAGLTLGGGVGWLTRAYGLTVDNLLRAEVITATGERVSASATDNSELFWGLRGGGGNFGVVTRFTFRAHPLGPDIVSGNLIYGLDQAREALQVYAAWTADLPDEMTSIISFLIPPPDWDLGDELLMIIGFVWAGPERTDGERLVDRLRTAARPTAENLAPVTWRTWQSAADGLFPRGSRAYWKNTSFERLDDATIDTLIGRARDLTWQGTAFDIHHMGGAFARVDEDATPFPNRAATYWLNVYGFWSDLADDDRRTQWVRGFARAMESHASGGVYINFLGQDGEAGGAGDPRTSRATREAALAVYGARKLERLIALKRRYDPDNLFRLNHNIPVE